MQKKKKKTECKLLLLLPTIKVNSQNVKNKFK